MNELIQFSIFANINLNKNIMEYLTGHAPKLYEVIFINDETNNNDKEFIVANNFSEIELCFEGLEILSITFVQFMNGSILPCK